MKVRACIITLLMPSLLIVGSVNAMPWYPTPAATATAVGCHISVPIVPPATQPAPTAPPASDTDSATIQMFSAVVAPSPTPGDCSCSAGGRRGYSCNCRVSSTSKRVICSCYTPDPDPKKMGIQMTCCYITDPEINVPLCSCNDANHIECHMVKNDKGQEVEKWLPPCLFTDAEVKGTYCGSKDLPPPGEEPK